MDMRHDVQHHVFVAFIVSLGVGADVSAIMGELRTFDSLERSSG